MLYFLYCLSKVLASLRKKPNNPHVGRGPRLKTTDLVHYNYMH